MHSLASYRSHSTHKSTICFDFHSVVP